MVLAAGATPAVAIVGGGPAPPARWPWMVAVLDRSERNGYLAQYCGATVIAPRRVLTAAHCVVDQKTRDVALLIGQTRLSAGGGRRVGVRAISVSPGFVRDRHGGFDAAVLRLSAPAHVPSLALARPGEQARWRAGTSAWTLGWGRLTAGLSPGRSEYFADRLRELEEPIVGDDACENAYGGGVEDLLYLPARIMCAGTGQGGTGICYGDSGGPLVVGGPGNWLQVGIVEGSDSCAGRGYFDLYTRVDRISAFALGSDLAVQPDPVTRPRVRGRFATGARVRCALGRWRGSPARFAVRWLRLREHPARTIATGRTHRLTERDVRHGVTCAVTARNRGGLNTVRATARRH